MTTIPYAQDDVTPEGLTALLSGRAEWSGLEITDLDCAPVGTGQMAHSYRLSLQYANRPDGAPDSVIAKVPSTDPTSRQMGLATGAYQREVFFYQHLAGLTPVRSPRCYFGQIADNNCDFLLLLEDLGPAATVEQVGGCTVDQAALALEQAAALHAGSWNHVTLREQSWLPVEHVWNALGGSIPQVIAPWLDRFGSHLQSAQIDAVERLGREVPAWLATLAEHRTLWHGDFRLDNLLFEAKGGTTPIAVIDWQSVAAAPGVIDVSYLLGTSLSETDRSSHERALVEHYHRLLIAHGVSGYTLDQCWREYQAHALYALVLNIPISLGVASTERGDSMFAAMASRAAQQIVENDSFAALASLTDR
ncbi:oxidoreductase family protein [Mycobacterium sp. GA-2829]|uniref:oxidoreductase family protein n=1 Tax=Mycobacterium sp. GA-2829 TaxID=1772283 RepID=UPI00073FD6DF|nr:oxidoreductase family protein [Mycobacterium sp. GA-2829]KUI34238.1 aminoglycoside phosphotransferase [Mycobacterium sp. GA-2829]